MIARLDQKSKLAKWEMYEFQKYAFHKSIVIVLHFDAVVVYLFSLRLNIFVMPKNAKEGSWLVAPNLPSSSRF